jgi:hypothetical protein
MPGTTENPRTTRTSSKLLRIAVPLMAAAIPVALAAAPANAADSGSSYQTTLNPLNHSTGSGMATITLNGDSADITVDWSGLASTFNGAPYPHVQHIHVGGAGMCPTTSADKNGDGVISTTEGGPAYGGIGTTLSEHGDTSPAAGTNIKIAPSGGSTSYHRVIQVTPSVASAIKGGTAVIVVHGLDPSTLSKKAQGEKSDLVPSLPLAATSPALCGVLTAMPVGGADTGTGSTAGVEHEGMLAGGGALVLGGLAAGGFAARRRRHVEL